MAVSKVYSEKQHEAAMEASEQLQQSRQGDVDVTLEGEIISEARLREYHKNTAVLQKGLVLGVLGLEMVMITQLVSLTQLSSLLQMALLAFALSIPLCAMGGVYRTIQSMTGESIANRFFQWMETVGVICGIAGLVAVFFHLSPRAGFVFATTSTFCTMITYYLFWKFRP